MRRVLHNPWQILEEEKHILNEESASQSVTKEETHFHWGECFATRGKEHMRRVLRNPWQRHNSKINFANGTSATILKHFSLAQKPCMQNGTAAYRWTTATKTSTVSTDLEQTSCQTTQNWNRPSGKRNSGLGISVGVVLDADGVVAVSKRRAQRVEWMHFSWCALLLTDGEEKLANCIEQSCNQISQDPNGLQHFVSTQFHRVSYMICSHMVWACHMFSMFALPFPTVFTTSSTRLHWFWFLNLSLSLSLSRSLTILFCLRCTFCVICCG